MIKNTLIVVKAVKKLKTLGGSKRESVIITQKTASVQKPQVKIMEKAEEEKTNTDSFLKDNLEELLSQLKSPQITDQIPAVLKFGSNNLEIAAALTKVPEVQMTDLFREVAKILEEHEQEAIVALIQKSSEKARNFYLNSELVSTAFKDKLNARSEQEAPVIEHKKFDPVSIEGESLKVGEPYSINTLDQMLAELRDPNFPNKLRALYKLADKKYEDLSRSFLIPPPRIQELTIKEQEAIKEIKKIIKKHEDEIIAVLKRDKKTKVIKFLVNSNLTSTAFKTKIATNKKPQNLFRDESKSEQKPSVTENKENVEVASGVEKEAEKTVISNLPPLIETIQNGNGKTKK